MKPCPQHSNHSDLRNICPYCTAEELYELKKYIHEIISHLNTYTTSLTEHDDSYLQLNKFIQDGERFIE